MIFHDWLSRSISDLRIFTHRCIRWDVLPFWATARIILNYVLLPDHVTYHLLVQVGGSVLDIRHDLNDWLLLLRVLWPLMTLVAFDELLLHAFLCDLRLVLKDYLRTLVLRLLHNLPVLSLPPVVLLLWLHLLSILIEVVPARVLALNLVRLEAYLLQVRTHSLNLVIYVWLVHRLVERLHLSVRLGVRDVVVELARLVREVRLHLWHDHLLVVHTLCHLSAAIRVTPIWMRVNASFVWTSGSSCARVEGVSLLAHGVRHLLLASLPVGSSCVLPLYRPKVDRLSDLLHLELLLLIHCLRELTRHIGHRLSQHSPRIVVLALGFLLLWILLHVIVFFVDDFFINFIIVLHLVGDIVLARFHLLSVVDFRLDLFPAFKVELLAVQH